MPRPAPLRALDCFLRDEIEADVVIVGSGAGGGVVARELAMLAPEGFLGAHVLQLFSFPSGDPAEFERMTPADYAALEFAGWFQGVDQRNKYPAGADPIVLGESVNSLTTYGYDPVTGMHEGKVTLCQIQSA